MKYNMRQARTHLSGLIRKACEGEEVIIARGKKPVVRLVALQDERGNRKPGALKGKLFYTPDAFDPLTDEEMREWGFE